MNLVEISLPESDKEIIIRWMLNNDVFIENFFKIWFIKEFLFAHSLSKYLHCFMKNDTFDIYKFNDLFKWFYDWIKYKEWEFDQIEEWEREEWKFYDIRISHLKQDPNIISNIFFKFWWDLSHSFASNWFSSQLNDYMLISGKSQVFLDNLSLYPIKLWLADYLKRIYNNLNDKFSSEIWKNIPNIELHNFLTSLQLDHLLHWKKKENLS